MSPRSHTEERDKHLLLVHRYFWPDTPLYASLLRLIAEMLAENGYRVTVLTAQPSYIGSTGKAPARETLVKRCEVRRFTLLPESRSLGPVRLINMVLFAVRVLLAGIRSPKVDAVMTATAPPVMIARIGTVIARRHRAPFIYHNQDIYPEVALAAGLIRPKVASFLRWVDRGTHLRASRTVVLSEDMRRTVEERGVARERIDVINNFDPFSSDEVSSELPQTKPDGPLRVAFAGNLGRFQGLEAVVEAANRLRDLPVLFDLIGDGALRQALEAEVTRRSLDNVRFHGYWPAVKVEEFLHDHVDLGIVPLAPGVIRTAYPSKTFSYLRQGCPIIALVEGDSELASTIDSCGLGFHTSPGNGAGLAAAVARCTTDRALLTPMRERAGNWAAMEASRPRRLAQWLALFDHVTDTRRTVTTID